MGVFQKFNGWLNDRGIQTPRGGDAGKISGNAYYASQGAQQAYGSLQRPAQDAQAMADSMAAGNATGRTQPVDRFSGDASDKYGGRVPYRSQKDMQAESDAQRQQAEDQQRRQQAAMAQQKGQQFGRAPAPQAAQPAYQQPSNVLPFPGMTRSPEGSYYAHVEYVVLLRSRNECTKVIEYIKANASVFLNMEFIANDSERQRCVDMLSGAAYTLGCNLSKISQRGIYLISSPSVYVVIDPALQKFAAVPESQGYVRPEYGSPVAYGASQTGYAAAPRGGYGAQQPMAQASGGRTAAYGTQSAGYGSGAQTAPYAAQQPMAQAAGARTAAYGTQSAGYGSGAQTAPYAAQQPMAQAAGGRTAAYGTQSAGYGSGAQTAPYAAQQPAQPNAQGGTPPQRRPGAPFGMQGAFVRSADGGQSR